MGGQHQIVRVDREQPAADHARRPKTALIAAVDMLADDCDAIMISDYAKGALTDRVLAAVMAAGRKSGVPVIVDPKRNDWQRLQGRDHHHAQPQGAAPGNPRRCATDAECEAAAGIAIRATTAQRSC